MTLTRPQITDLIIERCLKSGGPEKWSRKLDIQEPYIRAVISGRTSPGPRISRAVGYVASGDGWVKTGESK